MQQEIFCWLKNITFSREPLGASAMKGKLRVNIETSVNLVFFMVRHVDYTTV